MSKEQKKFKGKSYWFDNIFIDQGWCWATEEIEADDGHSDIVPLCLGKESEVVPVLKGDKPIPDGAHPRKRAILEEILGTQEEEHESRTTATTRARGLLRGRLIRNPRHIKRGAR